MAPAFSADKWVWLITPSSKEVCSQAQAGCVAAEALELKPSLGGELVATTEKVNFSLNPSSFQKAFNSLTGIPIL